MRRIESLQAVINQMKSDQTSLLKTEGQLRDQLVSLQRERTRLSSDVADYENLAKSATEDLRSSQKQLQDAKETIAFLEKKIASMKASAISSKPSTTPASNTGGEAKRPQTQLLRARSKNNNPPTKSLPKVH